MKEKIPPQAIELEKAVLGALLSQKDIAGEVADFLKPEMFYHDTHQLIYSTIITLFSAYQPIDILTVSESLERAGMIDNVGGRYYISSLTNAIENYASTVKHARIIVEKFLLREQIKVGHELMARAYETNADPFENQEQAEKRLHELSELVSNSEAVKIDEVLVNVFQELEELRHRETFLTGVPSRHTTLDKITMGWQKTDLIILAARPAIGKTAFTLSLALGSSTYVPSAFFSLEMSREQLVKRVLASQARMYLSSIKSANLSDEQMQHLFKNGLQPLSELPFYIDDTASLNVIDFKARLRRMIRKYGVKICFVDYLQLLKSTLGKNTNRQQQIGEISRELKIAAKELHIPIIALSQLNREADGKTPQLSNLREAGDLEQDADMVMFLYGHSEDDIKADASKGSEIFLKIAKHRNGALENIKFEYDKNYQTFKDLGEANEFKMNGFKSDDPF